MNIFKRLFKIGQSEANSAIDKMEDPIKMTDLRDLKCLARTWLVTTPTINFKYKFQT